MVSFSRIRRLCLIVMVSFLIFGCDSQSADDVKFQKGVDAYNRKDYATAFKELRPFAEKGKPIAQKNLGFMYYNGLGVQKNHELALQWFSKSAEQGNAKAQHNPGVMYSEGKGVPKDYKLSVRWYRKSEEQGYAGAQYNLGIMYAEGRGVPRDHVLVHMWWSISSANGSENATRSKSLLENIMTPYQLEKAQKLTREWMEKHKKK
ncbi:MAG: hypothetical protein CMH76_01195 [Nitrospinae bacterium]|nr:hypothetical protein [Nitrospinota bacterium]